MRIGGNLPIWISHIIYGYKTNPLVDFRDKAAWFRGFEDSTDAMLALTLMLVNKTAYTLTVGEGISERLEIIVNRHQLRVINLSRVYQKEWDYYVREYNRPKEPGYIQATVKDKIEYRDRMASYVKSARKIKPLQLKVDSWWSRLPRYAGLSETAVKEDRDNLLKVLTHQWLMRKAVAIQLKESEKMISNKETLSVPLQASIRGLFQRKQFLKERLLFLLKNPVKRWVIRRNIFLLKNRENIQDNVPSSGTNGENMSFLQKFGFTPVIQKLIVSYDRYDKANFEPWIQLQSFMTSVEAMILCLMATKNHLIDSVGREVYRISQLRDARMLDFENLLPGITLARESQRMRRLVPICRLVLRLNLKLIQWYAVLRQASSMEMVFDLFFNPAGMRGWFKIK